MYEYLCRLFFVVVVGWISVIFVIFRTRTHTQAHIHCLTLSVAQVYLLYSHLYSMLLVVFPILNWGRVVHRYDITSTDTQTYIHARTRIHMHTSPSRLDLSMCDSVSVSSDYLTFETSVARMIRLFERLRLYAFCGELLIGLSFYHMLPKFTTHFNVRLKK